MGRRVGGYWRGWAQPVSRWTVLGSEASSGPKTPGLSKREKLGHRVGEVGGLLVWPEDCDTEGQSLMELGVWGGTMDRRKGKTLRAAPSQRAAPSPGGELSQGRVCQIPARWKDSCPDPCPGGGTMG